MGFGRENSALNALIEKEIFMWDETVHGAAVKNAYENGSSYETICELMGIDYEDYESD